MTYSITLECKHSTLYLNCKIIALIHYKNKYSKIIKEIFWRNNISYYLCQNK